jgi:hypothetical protein
MRVRILIYNFLLVYGLGYWFSKLLYLVLGKRDSGTGIFSSHLVEYGNINWYPFFPTLSIFIAFYFLYTVRKMSKKMVTK